MAEDVIDPDYAGIIRNTLIEDLSKILYTYSNDGQILKELIQNAEDAGADKIAILYDERQSRPNDQCSKQESPYSKYFAGPALVVCNNEEFSEADWQGIRRIGTSIKKLDPSKVGRFGLGFKSVFHITDYPMIISGKQMMILDPYLDETRCYIPLELSKLKLYRGMNGCYKALFQVFNFGQHVLDAGYFKGTIFRFPLRQKETQLSDFVYNREQINNLLRVFKEEASLTLLFLKSLEEVSLYECMDSLNERNPDYKVTIGGHTHEIAKKARKAMHSKTIPDKDLVKVYELILLTSCKRQLIDQSSWLIVNRLEGISEANNSLLQLAEKLSYLPCVGIAVPLLSSNSFTGHTFCALPLPVQAVSMTGLPVHINGTFALSEDRKELKWADTFSESHKEDSVQWNELLVYNVLPKVYTDLIMYVRKHYDEQLLFRCIPDPSEIDIKFKECVSKLFTNLNDVPFLYTKSNGGKWIHWKDAVFPIFKENTDADIRGTLLYTMSQYNSCLVDSEGFERMYSILTKAFGRPPQDSSPQFVSKRLSKLNSVYKNFEEKHKLNLLAYLISSRDDGILISLELLPLADGSFIRFQTNKVSTIFVCSSTVRQLCPGMEDKLVRQVPDQVNKLILRLAKSGGTQLTEPTESDVLLLISHSIEKIHGKSQDQKTLRLQKLRQSDEEWLMSVWEYLWRTGMHLPHDLFILPNFDKRLGSYYLLRLNQPLIVESDGQNILPESVVRCLNETGVIVLKALPPYVSCCSEIYDKYVERPTVDGVLKLVSEFCKKLVKNFNDKVRSSDREDFVNFVGSNCTLKNAECILKELKMFNCNISGCYVSVEDVSCVAPDDFLPVPLPGKMIKPKTNTEKRLAELLGARHLSVTQVVKTILNTYIGRPCNDTQKKLMMEHILENISLFRHNTEIMSLVRQVEFVISGNGYIRKPNELFDPADHDLVQMFNDSGKFPHNENRTYLNILKTFGLKSSSDLKAADINNVAIFIHRKASLAQNESFKIIAGQANGLLNILMKNQHLFELNISNKTLKDVLADLKIIQPLRKPQSYPEVLQWFASPYMFCKPSKMVVNGDYLVGSTMSLFPDLPIEFIEKLNPKCRSIPIAKVFEQLLLLEKSYNEMLKPEYHYIVKQIYIYLYSFLNRTTTATAVICSMKNRSVVWTGHGFCKPQNIYLNSSNDDIYLEPYLYQLPDEFLYMKEFFQQLGCQECQSPQLLVDVQEQIKQNHVQVRTEKEYRRDLRHIINILNFFKIHFHDKIVYKVLIPVETDVKYQLLFKYIDECAYRNSHWSEDVNVLDKEEPFVVHPEITFASSIGIKSMEEHYLSETGVLNWEQEVSLITRIKSLLTCYRDGLSVPKELIQNADDAGATKVCFLYDERENMDCRTNLLNDNMSECQGPALWVYNDAQFCEADLKNITKVEEATKDLSKIGKFGVGFCSVYNLTDVPSFVSGNILVFFDPQGAYLMKNKTKGMKIDMNLLRNQRLLRKWSDQFKPFQNIFGCDLSTAGSRIPHYDGTLFRLPLRTQQQSGSKLSNIVYNQEEMCKLLDIFIKSAGNLLLFTQNVSEIEIYHLTEIDTRRKKLIFKVSRNLKWHSPLRFKEDEENRKNHNKVPVLKHWSQKIFNSSDKNARFENYQYSAEVEMKFKETGKHFHGQTGKSIKTTWMISWASGANQYFKQSIQNVGALMLPIAATAALIEDKNGERIAVPLSNAPHGFYKSSHIFCVLPLPIETPFNFHVSGSFAVTQDRRQLSIETNDEKKRIEFNWNQSVMKDAVVKSLISLLQCLKENNVKPGKELHLLWPISYSRSEDLDIYKATQDGFIAELLTSNQEIIFQSDLDHWTQFSTCRILDPQLSNSDVGLMAYRHTLLYLKDRGKILIKMPDWLLNHFTIIGGDLIIDSLFSTEMFYKEVFFPLVTRGIISDIDRNKLLLYAVDKNNEEINQSLKNHACFPSTRKILMKPSDIILKQSSLSKLFLPGDGYFLDFSVDQETEHRTELFKKLGMLYRRLSNCLIVNRCTSVEQLSRKCVYCAMQRCKDMFEYFERHPPEMDNELLNALTKIKFLPVMIKPKNWPFQWEVRGNVEKNKACGTKHKLKHVSPKMLLPQLFTMECPENLYFDDCKDLVCCTNLIVFSRAIITKNVDQVLQSLGLKGYKKTGVALHHVVRQIKILTNQCDIGKIQSLRPVLETILKWLDNECKELNYGIEEEMKSRLEPLQRSACLLINDALWSPSQVALNFEGNCLPYLVGVNQKDSYLSRCKTLLYFLDVKERYTTSDISKVLLSVKVKLTVKEPIDEQEVSQYCSLLNALCDALKEEDFGDGLYLPLKDGEILVPDDRNYLHPVHLLCLNDDVEIERSKSMKFACKHISRAQANMLGIKSKKRKKISEHYNEMPFGQTEDLTTRIHELLEGYPADEGIFKELLQNADDAGATEIHFVTDCNHYSSAKVFDGDFKDLQGPSLLVYNNSSFGDNDLKYIQLLGIGSKKNDPTSTGKYGVGFNAVYHLTDVPSFITKGKKMVKGNRTLCILDPLCKYATAADKRKPGSRYCDLDDLEDIVPDVFVPYHEEQLMGDEGTIFRFPLRKVPSEICDKPMDTDHLTSLLGQFKKEASRSLFFLNHIQKVLFSRVENGQIINEYSITIKMAPGDDSLKREFHAKRQKFAEIIKTRTQITAEPVLQIHTTITLLVSDQKTQQLEPDVETWFVVERIGFNKDDVPKEVHHAYSSGKLGLLPQGGVAVPLSKKGQLKFSAFCVLPLPIETGLPMNVNGHFALNHEYRRNLWEDNKESIQVTWNRTLMSSVVAPSYIAAIVKQRDICKESTNTWNSEHYVRNQLTKYFKYLPPVNKAGDGNWKYMCTEIYRQIAKEICLFPTISTEVRKISSIIPISTYQVSWICLKKRDSDSQSVFCLEDNHSVDPYSVVSIMKILNLQVIDLSSDLYEDMKACGIKVKSITPDIVTTFLKSHSDVNSDSCKIDGFGNDIEMSSFKTIWNVEKLLIYCKESKSFNQQLHNLPLCISNDKILMEFSETRPIYVTKHCNIMHGLEANFLNKNLYFTMKDTNSSCLKKFSLQDFEKLIKHVLSPHYYRDSVTSFTWNPKQKEIPNQDWLRDVWNFFADVSANDEEENEKTCHSLTNTLSNWYLLPVRKGRQQELHRIGLSKYIILGESFVTNKPLFGALKNIELPELDSDILLPQNTSPIQSQYVEAAHKKAETMVVSYGNLSGVFECFVYNLKQYALVISEDDCFAILEYFNDNFSTLKTKFSTCEIVQKLRSCPLFISSSGNNRNISNIDTKVLVVPTTIPDDGIKEWATASGIVLLTEYTRIKPLYIKLGFIHCNASELYSKYIIQKFRNMQREAQIEHLKYIRDNLLLQGIDREFSCVQEDIIEKLSKCHFLRKDGALVCAEEFCNPRNYLFKVMCTEHEFPPFPYNVKEWENFMELIGMKMEPSSEMILRFAKTISEEGLQSLSEETEFRSSLLLQHLLTRTTLLEELKCAPFSSIRSIRFIKPYELEISNCLLRIHKQYLNRRLVSFEDCTLFRKDVLPLVWTSTHILPEYATFNTEDGKKVLEYLGVHDLPTIEHVVKNLQHIAGSIHDKCSNESSFVTEDVALFLKDLFLKHYIFVEKNGLAHTCLMDLKATPIVFYNEEKICLLCDQVVLLLQDHEIIKPYIMRIPAEYLCCTKLFRVLGAQETTLPYHFAEVLRCLHRISCDEHSKPSILGPNEKKDILVPAVRNLFLKMRSEDQIGLTMTELYLPNREFILHLSKTLIVSDNNKLEKRANYFKDESLFAGLEKLNLQLEFSACILKLLPNEMKPKFLSEMLKEKLLKSLECPPGDKIQMLSQFVKTPKFIEGLLRLVFDEKIKQTSKFGMDTKACLLDEQEQNRISKQIGNTQFKHVSGLETALFFEGQQLEESTEKKKAFVKSVKIGDTKSWIMYCIDNGCHLQDWLNNIQLAFVKLLEKITNRGLHINQVYVHILLHSITDPDLISDKLDNEEIVQLHYANVSEDIYPDPGTYVPPSLHYLLDNSFSNLKVNDYVAVLLYEEEENNTGQFIDANNIYAKVIKCIDNSQNNCDIPEFEQVYLLDVGETEPNEVPAFKIFKFQRRRAQRSQDIVPSGNAFKHDDSQTLDNIVKDVKKHFFMIIKIADETKRRLLIRRLRAKWHPDQNFGNEGITTIVFQFIENLINDLKNGRLIDEDFNEQPSYRGEDLPRTPYYSSPPQYYQNHTQSHSTFTHGEKREKVSIPRTARKWLRQAECDRDAAGALFPNARVIPAFNWICYPCHQSAEKALKALWFNEDANNAFNSHNLSSIAIGLPQTLSNLAEAMVRIVGHHTRMRYPDQMSGDEIPSTIYSQDDAEECLRIASAIIFFVSQKIRKTGLSKNDEHML